MKVVKIVNKTKKTIIAEKVEVAKGFWKKVIGLMFRAGIEDDHGFLMEFEREGLYSIWMFGMKFAIDVVFLDSEKKVVDMFENIKPMNLNPLTWQLYKPSKRVKWILELKAGTVKKKKIAAGNTLFFN